MDIDLSRRADVVSPGSAGARQRDLVPGTQVLRPGPLRRRLRSRHPGAAATPRPAGGIHPRIAGGTRPAVARVGRPSRGRDWSCAMRRQRTSYRDWPSTGAAANAISPNSSMTTTWPQTMAAGNGRRRAVAMPSRISASSIRWARAASSIPKASSSRITCPQLAGLPTHALHEPRAAGALELAAAGVESGPQARL